MADLHGNEYRPLHVYRQKFSPSAELDNLARELLKLDDKSSFSIYSTKEAYVDSLDNSLNRYHEQRTQAEAAMSLAASRPFVIARLGAAAKKYAPYALDGSIVEDVTGVRIALLPYDENRFNNLAKSLDYFPDIFPRMEPSVPYMFMDFRNISRDVAENLDNRALRADRYVNSKIASGMLSASLIGLTGQETVRPVSRIREDWRSDNS